MKDHPKEYSELQQDQAKTRIKIFLCTHKLKDKGSYLKCSECEFSWDIDFPIITVLPLKAGHLIVFHDNDCDFEIGEAS